MEYLLKMRQQGDVCPVVGIMSGTSLDGVDFALVLLQGSGPELVVHEVVHFETVPLDPRVRRLIRSALTSDEKTLPVLCELNAIWSRTVGDEITRLLTTRKGTDDCSVWQPSRVVIGSHGQTMWHDASRRGDMNGNSTLQLGDGEILAYRCGCVTVSNFRSGDIAVGGCGAPLVPYLDRILVNMIRNSSRVKRGAASQGAVVALQNLGGIGNVTWFGPDERDMIAFDTGPANVMLNELLDQLLSVYGNDNVWVERVWVPLRAAMSGNNSAPTTTAAHVALCDHNGFFSSQGVVNHSWIEEWWALSEPYVSSTPPKTSGREAFGSQFVTEHVVPKVVLPPESVSSSDSAAFGAVFQRLCDACRSCIAFTVETIRFSYVHHLPSFPDIVVVSGGGTAHPIMVEELRRAICESRPSAIVARLSDLLMSDGGSTGAADSDGYGGLVRGCHGTTWDDAKEAVAFAVLAHEKLNALAGVFRGAGTNEPLATGACRSVVLGQISVPL